MSHWLDGLAGRTTLVLMVSIALVHLVSLHGYRRSLTEETTLASEARLADRMVTIMRAVTLAPEEERDLVAHNLSGGAIRAHWSRTDHAVPGGPGSQNLGELARRLEAMAPELAGGGLTIGTGGDGGLDDPHVALISFRLPDSGWLNVALLSYAVPPPVTAGRTLLSTSLMALGGLVLAAFLVRWLSRPLGAFARAAQSFSEGAAASPVAETGPREVRALARAFNDMQARIARLILDRTQALAAVSHDLKTPITRLRFRAEEIADPDLAGAVARDLDEMERMIDQTLAFLRGERRDEELRPVDLVTILETVADGLADRGAEVTLDVPDRAVIAGRRLALKRAFGNLAENAVKYGGKARISLVEGRDDLVVEIEDDGPGIAPGDRARALEPFVRLEPSRNVETGGFGLGLTIAASIVDGHGGTLALLDGEGGGGLLVRVTLPRNH